MIPAYLVIGTAGDGGIAKQQDRSKEKKRNF